MLLSWLEGRGDSGEPGWADRARECLAPHNRRRLTPFASVHRLASPAAVGVSMLRKATALFLLVPLAACGRTAPGVGLDPEAPLEAALLPPQYGDVGFWVSHPAHVAVFEFAPTRGVALLFPSLAGERNYMTRPGSY